MGRPEEENEDQDLVSIEIFFEKDGSTLVELQISREDFDRYELAASTLGISVENLMLEAFEQQIQDQQTSWSLPVVDEHGKLDLENSIPLSLSSPVVDGLVDSYREDTTA